MFVLMLGFCISFFAAGSWLKLKKKTCKNRASQQKIGSSYFVRVDELSTVCGKTDKCHVYVLILNRRPFLYSDIYCNRQFQKSVSGQSLVSSQTSKVYYSSFVENNKFS